MLYLYQAAWKYLSPLKYYAVFVFLLHILKSFVNEISWAISTFMFEKRKLGVFFCLGFLLFLFACNVEKNSEPLKIEKKISIKIPVAPQISNKNFLKTKQIRNVIIISIDGLATRFVDEMIAAKTLPTFSRLQRESSWTHKARTDYFQTTTMANHTCMITGLPSGHTKGFDEKLHHGYIYNSVPPLNSTIHNSGNKALKYIPSVFDVAHDFELKTCLFASKSKFVFFQRSYNEKNGALDKIGKNNGKAKIDKTILKIDTNELVNLLINELGETPCNLTLFHIKDSDFVGHGFGWGSDPWKEAIKHSDSLINKILTQIDQNPKLKDHTALIVTADHGGIDGNHGDMSKAENYSIPFYVWGPGIPSGVDLYSILKNRKHPGKINPDYTAKIQPIRNGEVGNLALELLNLPAIPGSTMFDMNIPIK